MTSITYPIVETFHSLQGEGSWAGVSAFFIRLGGCDVHCSFCDTKNSWKREVHPQISIDRLLEEAKQVNPRIVVITGGEPLLHNLEPLTTAFHQHNLPIHLETSGAHSLTGQFDWLTLSPKTFRQPQENIYAQAQELKVVVQSDRDLEWAEQVASKVSSSTHLYLQPEWFTPESKALVINYILHNPKWRLSIQSHKYLGIN